MSDQASLGRLAIVLNVLPEFSLLIPLGDSSLRFGSRDSRMKYSVHFHKSADLDRNELLSVDGSVISALGHLVFVDPSIFSSINLRNKPSFVVCLVLGSLVKTLLVGQLQVVSFHYARRMEPNRIHLVDT
jgi:hypothetical protein